jgi:hypothetical protein
MKLGLNPLPRPAGSHSSHDCRVAPLGKGVAIPGGLRLALAA